MNFCYTIPGGNMLRDKMSFRIKLGFMNGIWIIKNYGSKASFAGLLNGD